MSGRSDRTDGEGASDWSWLTGGPSFAAETGRIARRSSTPAQMPQQLDELAVLQRRAQELSIRSGRTPETGMRAMLGTIRTLEARGWNLNAGAAAIFATEPSSSACADIRPVDFNDPQAHADCRAFVEELNRTSGASYWKRFDYVNVDESVDAIMRESRGAIFAYRDGKVVGVENHVEDASFPRGTVACPNYVVLDAYQGLGIGKELLRKSNEDFRRKGYQYTVSGVHSFNADQVDRFIKDGWREMSDSQTSDSGSDDVMPYTRYFWKALDPRLADVEPQRRG